MKFLKNSIFILVILFCGTKTIAQLPGSYIINNTMTAFHGTWQYANGEDTLRIYLVTKKIHDNSINGGFDWDRLVGWHIYKRGNITLQSSFGFLNNLEQKTIRGGNENILSQINGTIKDLTSNKMGKLTLTLNSTNDQLFWKLESTPGIKARKPTDTPIQYGFSLPKNIILNKL